MVYTHVCILLVALIFGYAVGMLCNVRHLTRPHQGLALPCSRWRRRKLINSYRCSLQLPLLDCDWFLSLSSGRHTLIKAFFYRLG
ncbi:hypothetical protein C8J56DRAFT_968011, partial [Mycena floridula]